MADVALKPIPVVDIRSIGIVQYAQEGRERALALRDECLAWFPRAAAPVVPLLDAVTRHWLRRSCSPYVGEIASISAALGFSGIWLLNGSYQLCCTSLAREQDGAPWLARTLDWPFHGLGRHVELALMSGSAGDFWNVSWPGYAGVLTAMAPGRFAASINQAPLRRRTRHPRLRSYDIARAALGTIVSVRDIPPDQLLRQAFETCRDFQAARAMLETTRIARPVIYTLVGCKAGESCVIERTETAFTTRCDETSTANDWLHAVEPWEARVGGKLALTCSFAQAGERSRARQEALQHWSGRFPSHGFEWVTEPVLNPYTRLAAEMCPSDGTMRVVGYEVSPGLRLPKPATLPCEIAGGLPQAA